MAHDWTYNVNVRFQNRADASRFHAACVEMGLDAELPIPLQANANQPQINAGETYELPMPNPFGDGESPVTAPTTNTAEPTTPILDGDVLPMPGQW